MKPKWTAQQIELAVADHFNVRKNLIVSNVSWGLFKYHEADLLVLTPSNWCSEVEIKVSSSDIKKDLEKKHKHLEKNIINLWFAVPEFLDSDINIPKHAGILSVSRYRYGKQIRYRVIKKRLPINNKARKFTEEERLKLLRLGCLRIWSLKQKLNDRVDYLTEKVTGWTKEKKIDLPLHAKDSKFMKILKYGERDNSNFVYKNCIVSFAITEKGIYEF